MKWASAPRTVPFLLLAAMRGVEAGRDQATVLGSEGFFLGCSESLETLSKGAFARFTCRRPCALLAQESFRTSAMSCPAGHKSQQRHSCKF